MLGRPGCYSHKALDVWQLPQAHWWANMLVVRISFGPRQSRSWIYIGARGIKSRLSSSMTEYTVPGELPHILVFHKLGCNWEDESLAVPRAEREPEQCSSVQTPKDFVATSCSLIESSIPFLVIFRSSFQRSLLDVRRHD